MRKTIPVPTDIPEKNTKLAKEEFDVELITPMYGGGAKTGQNDLDFPIRPTSIRGLLRFWWRATRGAQFETSNALFDREKEIWGSTDTPSSTKVKVKLISQAESCLVENYGFARYVLFSAAAKKHNLVKEDLKFKFSVSYKGEFEKDVLCAAWAWVNFGGIGARTRRGCGALYCKELAPEKPESFRDWFEQKIKLYGLNLGATREWPTLSWRILLGKAAKTHLDAWKNTIIPMREFRQGDNIGRNPGSTHNRPGRSRWPEPDTLRNKFGHSPEHKPIIPTEGFPRAAFGLPIIFDFRGCSGEPPKSELRPQNQNAKRMGSPVVLRPLRTQDGQNIPLAAFLKAPLPGGLELKIGNRTTPANHNIINPAFAEYYNSPMARSANGSVLEAFVAYLKEDNNNFKEVGR